METVVHQLSLRLSNAQLVLGDKPVLVDAGAPGECDAIVKAMQAVGVDPADVALVFLTHVHGDHVGAAAEFARRFGCPVGFHNGDQPIMDRGDNGVLEPIGLRGKILQPFFSKGAFERVEQSFELKDGMRIDEFGVAGQVIHTPGHTAGSVSLLLDNGDAIVGDVMMGGFMGGKLLPARPMYPYFCEDFGLVETSIKKIASLASGSLFVGHGGPLTVRAVRKKFG
jgi:glyoxylase-like metal-dependent hydrolase (beta-lactamase superfamily II)